MFTLMRITMSNTRTCGQPARMLSTYEDAVTVLRGLQSNIAFIQSANRNNQNQLKDTEKYLLRTGINVEQLDNLSVIHVSGTKGKGSTCAFTEAILRKHGFRTGFFSSPHLVTVRERLRINGRPLSQEAFTNYFWETYKKLETAKEFESDIPTYFKFLTIMMFNVFLHEDIDVAIVEVGIGGELDCTNVIRKPVCVGITSLGLDHTSLLGKSIKEIAYQKSGIFKRNTIAFTIPQPEEVMQILRNRAVEKQCTLRVVPSFTSYDWANVSTDHKIVDQIQQQNASLAIELAVQWMKVYSGKHLKCPVNSKISFNKIAFALSTCQWPGRMQILLSSTVDFYLDGAHTLESIDCCIRWFDNKTANGKGRKYLIFNMTGQRDPYYPLSRLKQLNFYRAYFVPNLVGITHIDAQTNFSFIDQQKARCRDHAEIWGEGCTLANNVMEVLYSIKTESLMDQTNANKNDKPQVLITGSLHLVGSVLAILDPDLTMSTNF